MSEEEVEKMLRQLREHYGEPVLPLSRFCRGIHQWGQAMAASGGEHVQFGRDVKHAVLARAPKSNLLHRIFWLGEAPRTVPCPVHGGKWSGLSPEPCACKSGSNVTGWLAQEPQP